MTSEMKNTPVAPSFPSSVMACLRRKKIGLLCGGWSAERPISLKSGAAVGGALKRLGLRFVKIDVTRRLPEQICRAKIDVAFLVLHGPVGEDGTVQGLLEIMGVPYTGSGVLASALAMHKPSAKRIFEAAGLPTPKWRVLRRHDNLRPPFSGPWVIKPASQGSAIGVHIVKKSSGWSKALNQAFRLENEIVVEQYIHGTEATVAVLGDRTLPVIEIVPKHGFYDFYSKYAKGGSSHLIPARLPSAVLRKVSVLSRRAFEVLGCRHFARVDLMVPRSGRPTLLEVNTLPGMTATSLFPDAARAVGMNFDRLILEILAMAVPVSRAVPRC